ncbi:predicted protein [Chaetoceros tenuissimus]|uniref:Uncharacterized protein n=1 Tax=Chaetoceros tenuissimus TaxID=426638 RepID=A0AAD3H8X1_9STRA|nr:predicted protein [Chaetoceros tenuissimus]
MSRQIGKLWVWYLVAAVYQLNVADGTTATRRNFLRGNESYISTTSNEQSVYTMHYEKMKIATEKLLSMELFREMNLQNQTIEKKEIEELNYHIMHTKIKKRKDASKSSRKTRMLELFQEVSEQNRKFAQNEL